MSDASLRPVAPRVFSGIQPSGSLTLGNYLGAIKRFVALQDTHECLYCAVDLHAITVWQDPEALQSNTRELVAALIASGIDAQEQIVFNQSRVPAHAELAWIFNCVARIGWMNRMTQFKEKAGKNRENASIGLYAYPALMAADILAYRATHVPVGEDQKQHLELARDIAAKFNNDYAERIQDLGPQYAVDEEGRPGFFPLTEPLIQGEATRVMSLRDGSKKMSKSDPSDASRINMTDDADTIAKKIRKAKTDPEPLPSELAGLDDRPEARNLVNIYAALSDQTLEQAMADVGGQQFGTFKPRLAELAVDRLAPISQEMSRLMADPAEIDRILARGAEQAREITAPILKRTYEIVGMVGA